MYVIYVRCLSIKGFEPDIDFFFRVIHVICVPDAPDITIARHVIPQTVAGYGSDVPDTSDTVWDVGRYKSSAGK